MNGGAIVACGSRVDDRSATSAAMESLTRRRVLMNTAWHIAGWMNGWFARLLSS